MRIEDFDYHLPDELIAQFPPEVRGSSRLLDVAADQLHDRQFAQLPQLLRAGDVLVFNDTKVIKARMYGEKASGGRIEALIERVLDTHRALAMVRASKSPKPGSVLHFHGGFRAVMRERQADLFLLEFDFSAAPAGVASVLDMLEQVGSLPLPPYITHVAGEEDERRYQTVYARDPGAVAAPTAGLHFTDELLASLREQGVGLEFLTLHVGAGTFKPVLVDKVENHVMHSERYRIAPDVVERLKAARAAGGRIIAVGTTSLRALEAASQNEVLGEPEGDTNIFITPGYRFRVVDGMVTNFHLPRSTLLMLVSAFAGYQAIKEAYQHAVAQGYRFFSYGDAMLLQRRDDAPKA